MSSSELFDMDYSSPVASTSAQPVAQRFLVDYAPPTHIKPSAIDQHPAPRRVKSPAQTTETQNTQTTTVSYISGDDNERIRRWLLATRQALQTAQTQTQSDKAKSAFSDSEEDEDEDEDSISDDESKSSCDSESDSDRIFLQPRRHQQSSSSLPPHLHPRTRQALSPSPAAGNGKSKSSSPLPVFPRRRTAPGSVTAMMMSHLTAARPALPVVCLSEASGQVDISPSSSSFQSYSPSHSRSGSRDQHQQPSRWSSSCSIQQPRSQPSWYEDDEDDSLNLPALVEDDECAPASTSTRSLPIPIAAQFTVPRRARARGPGRGRATQRNPIEFGNADAKFGLQSAFDDSSEDEDEDEFESDDEERQIIVEEEQWDEDYQSPPRRRALNAAKGHMDGQSFYNGWLSQYHNQALVADNRA